MLIVEDAPSASSNAFFFFTDTACKEKKHYSSFECIKTNQNKNCFRVRVWARWVKGLERCLFLLRIFPRDVSAHEKSRLKRTKYIQHYPKNSLNLVCFCVCVNLLDRNLIQQEFMRRFLSNADM